ncbi:MAG: hypothetical protein AAF253_14830, partial [Pseudomonadota bacterium]
PSRAAAKKMKLKEGDGDPHPNLELSARSMWASDTGSDKAALSAIHVSAAIRDQTKEPRANWLGAFPVYEVSDLKRRTAS